jgi:hypothetical protein
MEPTVSASHAAEAADDHLSAPSASASLRGLSEAALRFASAKVDDWTTRLSAIAAPSGAAQRAGVEAAKASVIGKNPVWAALKGAWLGASAPVRVAVVLSLVLLLVGAPVLLLLLLLGLLVTGIIAAVRTARS